RSAENVLDEMELLVKKYGRREIQFIDDNLTLNKPRAMRIFKGIIERKLNIHWNTPNGIAIWTVDEEMLDMMKASGCYELTIAFESGDQEVLNRIIKKPLNLEKAAGLVSKIRKRGILTYGFFISGFPGEKKEQVQRTFAFAKKMDLDGAAFFIANPTPGSDLHKICLEKGYIKDDFSFGSIEYNWPNFGTDDMSADELERFVLKNFNAFLLRVFLRHPLRFLKKYLRVFLTHPVMSLRTTYADIERLLVNKWKKEKK
ncbi:MAG: radical SAM protein, partial [Candidatus Omnitrophica bacterium]|nr:radical SAM protein [Candidatus Omnitrophota bacterium]